MPGQVFYEQYNNAVLAAITSGGNTMESCMMTVSQTAEYLNIPLSKVYELVNSEDFPAAKIGKNWRIPKDRLEPWIDCQIRKSRPQ